MYMNAARVSWTHEWLPIAAVVTVSKEPGSTLFTAAVLPVCGPLFGGVWMAPIAKR